LHVPLFGLLAWLWYSTLDTWSVRHGPALGIAFLMAAGFGAFDEWHQLHVPGRYASFTDIALNCAGAMLALWWAHRSERQRGCPEIGNRTSG
jgi:VanZ family protein